MSNARTIWNILKSKGMTDAGAAGSLGNMEAESGLVPCRLQGDYNRTDGKCYPTSQAYAAKVDSGRMTGEQFAHDSTGGGGWGLCQWTYWSRKLGLYNFCKARGASIGDLTAQVEYYVKELRESYPTVWGVLTSTTDVRTASDAVMLKYERPADQSQVKRNYRAGLCQVYYDTYKGTGAAVADEKPATSNTEEVDDMVVCTITGRQLQKGDTGAPVKVAQVLLAFHGFGCGSAGADGHFGDATEAAAIKFQKKRGLKADGIIGPATWRKLLGVN